MISSIEIKNFKSIKSKVFPLRNLNVLLGLNGQGKSSFIQSLLLLRQSNTEPGRSKGWLNLKGKYVDIGNSKDAFYQYAKKEDLIFNLSIGANTTIPFHYAYEMADDVLPPKLDLNLNGETKIDFESLFQDAKKYTGLFSNQFQYLNAYRIQPESTYPKSNNKVVQNRNIGTNGQYAAHFIETYHDEEVAFENLLHPKSFLEDKLLKKTLVNKTLINQINLWLGEISPGINVRTTSVNQDEVLLEYVFDQPTYGSTNKFKPINVGFGITYALPVVTALLSAKTGALLIIENPESHIHPRGQAELGKLIALVAQNDVQIIIETHSDHIVNGIRVGIKEEKLSKDKVRLFYFKKIVEEQEQYSAITDIVLDKNGTLSEYPENLLDEWTNQLAKLI
jgi:predicted ATPase